MNISDYARKNHAKTGYYRAKPCLLSVGINFRVNITMQIHIKMYVIVGQITQNYELNYMVLPHYDSYDWNGSMERRNQVLRPFLSSFPI